jgi:hypothetical protein
MKGFHVAEAGHVVNILPPVDVTGGVTADRFNMKNYAHASIILQVGASAAAFTKILVNECDAATSGNSTAIPFKLYAEETAAGDTLGAAEAVAATGKTPSANDNITYVIEINASELSDGFNFVELELTNGSNSVIASAVAVLSGARYANAESATALA